MESTSIHPGTQVGRVALRVADLARSLAFYEGVLGFQRVEVGNGKASLGALDGSPLLDLIELPDAPPQPRTAAGLYHVAILLPSRADLGQALRRLAEARINIGQADHLVSEALYCSDPDDNGLEIYRDRPRSEWHWANGRVQMATDPLDLDAILAEGDNAGHPWAGLPAGTRIGHMHLQVGDIAQAQQFYHSVLGFDIVASMPSALFVSAGGYHHHIGMNIWHSRGAGPSPKNTAGLGMFELTVPDQAALEAVKARLVAHDIPMQEQGSEVIVADPWQNEIHLVIVPLPMT